MGAFNQHPCDHVLVPLDLPPGMRCHPCLRQGVARPVVLLVHVQSHPQLEVGHLFALQPGSCNMLGQAPPACTLHLPSLTQKLLLCPELSMTTMRHCGRRALRLAPLPWRQRMLAAAFWLSAHNCCVLSGKGVFVWTGRMQRSLWLCHLRPQDCAQDPARLVRRERQRPAAEAAAQARAHTGCSTGPTGWARTTS